jgi:hypothetical protein
MKATDTEDEYSPEETERRAKAAIRRSFEMPYKPQKELVGKTPRARARKPKSAKSSPKES